MRNNTQLRFGLMLACLLLWSCESRPGWEGEYVSHPGSDPAGAVTLILESGGKGIWIIDQESSPLRWEQRGGSLWFHFKTGGVLIARPNPSDQTLSVEIPGSMSLPLHKSP
ncbi:MAG: hypothetical protein JSW26_26765 [Desulfobacterales bacterium]|nr:MAG: hypothetical protein JSW26_26765 [Desulfobacterales bacterium]